MVCGPNDSISKTFITDDGPKIFEYALIKVQFYTNEEPFGENWNEFPVLFGTKFALIKLNFNKISHNSLQTK